MENNQRTCCCRVPLNTIGFFFVLIKSIAIILAVSLKLPYDNRKKTIFHTLSAVYCVHIIVEAIMMVVTTMITRSRERTSY
ncbi:MAG: hypothetical protein MHPSP_003410, partial [Paramarteilia canceri]